MISLIAPILDRIIPGRRRRRIAAARSLVARITRYVIKAAASAREKFHEVHHKLPMRGDWKATEHCIRAWEGVLWLWRQNGFEPAKELPVDVLESLKVQFVSVFVGEAPLPGELSDD